jgi:hypothetical protein
MNIGINGIDNFLNFLNENWTMISAIITVAFIIYDNIKNISKKSKEEQVEIAKSQIKVIMLRLVTEAECDYREWVQSGEIKRAQVIDNVFTMYPILSKVSNQADIIKWIDDCIDLALKTMRKIFEENPGEK